MVLRLANKTCNTIQITVYPCQSGTKYSTEQLRDNVTHCKNAMQSTPADQHRQRNRWIYVRSAGR